MPNQPQEFLSGYSGETIEELISKASDYRIDSIVLALEQALEQLSVERSLTTEESIVLTIEALEREVNNGGYLQFFENSSREHASSVVQALKSISCPQVAELTQRAIATLHIQGEITEAAGLPHFELLTFRKVSRVLSQSAALILLPRMVSLTDWSALR
ncbi:MAG: DMP19 family protein, partial [Akkermansiaceae bacterium]|nr:DMP19 family protein [Akkermansiaceae bacterium]